MIEYDIRCSLGDWTLVNLLHCIDRSELQEAVDAEERYMRRRANDTETPFTWEIVSESKLS